MTWRRRINLACFGADIAMIVMPYTPGALRLFFVVLALLSGFSEYMESTEP